MTTLLSVSPARQWFTEQQAAQFRIPQKFEVDLLQRLAGDFYDAGMPGEVREVAARLQMGATTLWRRRSGAEATPLSRAGEEALLIRRAGYPVGWMSAYIDTVALLPTVERLTLRETNELLLGAHALEGESNRALDRWQELHLTRGETPFYQMAQAAINQRDKSSYLAALALRLHMLRRDDS